MRLVPRRVLTLFGLGTLATQASWRPSVGPCGTVSDRATTAGCHNGPPNGGDTKAMKRQHRLLPSPPAPLPKGERGPEGDAGCFRDAVSVGFQAQ